MRIWAVAFAAAALLAAGAATAAFLLSRRFAPVTLTLWHPFPLDADASALRQAAAEFTSLYPRITVRTEARDPILLRGAGLQEAAGGGVDVIAATGPAAEGAAVWASIPSAWTGTLWVLAARRDILEKAGVSETALAALRAGSMSPAAFVGLLETLKAGNWEPLTLGNSHRWPFLLWLQHWAAATVGSDAVKTLPTGDPGRDKAFLDRLKPAFEALSSWKERGFFAPEAWKEGWARGLAPLAEGRAVFALLSTPMLSALPETVRQELEFLPFPGSRSGSPWTIGSVYLLGVVKASAHQKDAALLVTYLSSPGVTKLLSRRLARPFFSWNAETGKPQEAIADWYGAANTSGFDVLAEAFRLP